MCSSSSRGAAATRHLATSTALNERARKSIAQKQATNNDFEQTPGFRKSLRTPTKRWGREDCSRVALGYLVMESAARLLKVCVIGGGIAGLACAWSLVRRGHVDVEVFEAEGQLCSQASARNAAIYRPLEADPAITKLAWRNRLLLSDLAGNERLSLLRRTGILFLDDRSNSLQAHAKVADRFGIPWSWVEAPAARWPNVLGAMPTRYRGLYCPDGGVLDIHEIAERLRRSLQDAGVHVSLNERVSLKCRSDSGPMRRMPT